MSFILSILTSIAAFFSWEPATPKEADIVEVDRFVASRVYMRDHDTRIVIETKPLSAAPYKR